MTPPIAAQVCGTVVTTPAAEVVGMGVTAYDGTIQVPAQHIEESVVLTMLPEQVSSARQMTPPIAAQVCGIITSGVGWANVLIDVVTGTPATAGVVP
jgi:hypothetical protein